MTVDITAHWPSKNGPMSYFTGESLFEAACMPNSQTSFGSYTKSHNSNSTYKLPLSGSVRYPNPVAKDQAGLIQGHYLSQSAGAQNVAVLQVPTFRLGNGTSAFAQTAIKFLKRAQREGKSRIIVDLSGNGGGDINQGFNLFRIFYPDRPIYSATRFRSTELLRYMGQIFSQAVLFGVNTVGAGPIVFQNAVTPDQGGHFASLEQLYQSKYIFGAEMSNLYATFNFSTASDEHNPISGFGGIPLDPPTQLFKTENIVIVRLQRSSSTNLNTF